MNTKTILVISGVLVVVVGSAWALFSSNQGGKDKSKVRITNVKESALKDAKQRLKDLSKSSD